MPKNNSDLIQRLTFCAACTAALPDGAKQGIWEKAVKADSSNPRKEYFRMIFKEEKDLLETFDFING